jgi:hypothetical protein
MRLAVLRRAPTAKNDRPPQTAGKINQLRPGEVDHFYNAKLIIFPALQTPDEHRRRVEARSPDIEGLVLPDWQAVVRRAYDSWDRNRLVIDTAHRTLDACVEEALILWRSDPTHL